jgi:hypothetical protein
VEKSFDHYGLVYREVVRGVSEKTIQENRYYFKHPTQSEHFFINSNYNLILADARKRGLQSEDDKISDAIKSGWWTAEKENKFLSIRDAIFSLQKTKENLILPSQKDQIEVQIQKNKNILTTYQKERVELIGYTAEKYASDRLHDEMVMELTYKNPELTEKLFCNQEDYYYLSDDIVEKIRDAFYSCSGMFMQQALRYVAASPFFQNMLYVTNECDAFHFWGKPVSFCTKYQIDVLISGKIFRNAIKSEIENGKKLPEEILSDPEKFILWYDSRSANKEMSNNGDSDSSIGSSTAVSSFVGATKEDLKKMGVKVQKIKGKSLLELAADSGGVLEKHQYLNARDGN